MILLRHASAGERLASTEEDRARGLDARGINDAFLLPAALAGCRVERVVSSPLPRCVDTVTLFADARGLELELRDELAPEASREDALALLATLPQATVVCTHREIIERVLPEGHHCEKGGSWVVEHRDGELTPLAYLPPPSAVRELGRRVAHAS